MLHLAILRPRVEIVGKSLEPSRKPCGLRPTGNSICRLQAGKGEGVEIRLPSNQQESRRLPPNQIGSERWQLDIGEV